MKKCTALALILMLLFALQFAAFADLDEGDFDDWVVRCGAAGYAFVDQPYYGIDENTDLHDFLEPGTKLYVHSYDSTEKTYLLVVDDDRHETKGSGFVYVTEAQLNKYFIGEKKAVRADNGTKLSKPVDCTVTPDVGVILRQGPATTYPSFRTVPKGTKLTYQYTLAYGGRNWAYTTYKGTNGWVCIDYTAPVTTTSPTTTEITTTETTTTTASTTTETTANSTKYITTTTAAVPTTSSIPAERDASADAADGFFSDTKTVVVVCCLCAVVLALSATVILLIVKRKKNG